MQQIIDQILSQDLKVRKIGLLMLKKHIEIPRFIFNALLLHDDNNFIEKFVKILLQYEIVYQMIDDNYYRFSLGDSYYISRFLRGFWVISER